MDDDVEIRHHIDDMPQDAVPTAVLEVVEYLNGDGHPSFVFRYGGCDSVAAMLGLLELVRDDLLQRYGPSRQPDDD